MWVKIWHKSEYLTCIKVDSFRELNGWIINHLDLSDYDKKLYKFEVLIKGKKFEFLAVP